MGKGSKRRKCQVSQEVETSNWESIFGKKKLNVMSDEDKIELGIEIPYFNRMSVLDKIIEEGEIQAGFDKLDEIDKIIKEGEHQICGSHYEGTEDFRGSDY